jgi:hypothetical protein
LTSTNQITTQKPATHHPLQVLSIATLGAEKASSNHPANEDIYPTILSVHHRYTGPIKTAQSPTLPNANVFAKVSLLVNRHPTLFQTPTNQSSLP